MFVTRDGAVMEIRDETYLYWQTLGWKIDANRDGIPDDQQGGGGVGGGATDAGVADLVTNGPLTKAALSASIGQRPPTPQQFGAKGNGIDDDTAAINAAIASVASRGGEVYFPPGVYNVSQPLDVVPGGVTLVGSGFDYSDPGTAAAPILPSKASVIRATATMDTLITLGSNGSSSAAGQTGASLREISVHGSNLASTVVKTAGRRNRILQTQIYWGATQAVLLAGQNSHMIGCVASQDNTGDVIRISGFYDNKVWDSQVRQPGSTGAAIRVKAANTDIQRNHIWAGQNGTPKSAQGLVVVDGGYDKVLINDNTIEGVIGPEILLITNASDPLQNVVIAINRFYMNNGIATDTYPVVAVTGVGILESLNITSNAIAGAENGRRYKSILDLGPSLASVERVSVSNTEADCVLSVLSGTSYPGVRQNNVRIFDGVSTKATNDGGTFSAVGDGSTKTFTILHGLTGAPKSVQLTPGSEAAAAARYVTTSSSALTVTYTTAPANGAAIVLFWTGSVSGATSTSGPISDTTAPTISSFTATPGDTTVGLAWTATDDIGVTRSVVTRGATTVYDGNGSSATDTGLTNGTSYTYTLTVYDAAGNTKTASASATPAAGANPGTGTVFVNDTMTGADDTSLTSHTGETGATWTIHPAAPNSAAALIGNRVRGTANQAMRFLASGTPTTADYQVEADLYFPNAPSTQVGQAGVMLRADATANTGYYLRWITTTGWRLDRVKDGTQTTLGAATTTPTPVAGQTMHVVLKVSGNRLTVTVNGTQIYDVSDTDATNAISAAGRAAIWIQGSTGITSLIQIDNFKATNA